MIANRKRSAPEMPPFAPQQTRDDVSCCTEDEQFIGDQYYH